MKAKLTNRVFIPCEGDIVRVTATNSGYMNCAIWTDYGDIDADDGELWEECAEKAFDILQAVL